MGDVSGPAPFGSLGKPPKKQPKIYKGLKTRGKEDATWQRIRREWFRKNPPDYRGTWPCGLCGNAVHKDEVDLDHIIPKGSRPDLQSDINNLRPVHRSCHIRHTAKGGV